MSSNADTITFKALHVDSLISLIVQNTCIEVSIKTQQNLTNICTLLEMANRNKISDSLLTSIDQISEKITQLLLTQEKENKHSSKKKTTTAEIKPFIDITKNINKKETHDDRNNECKPTVTLPTLLTIRPTELIIINQQKSEDNDEFTITRYQPIELKPFNKLASCWKPERGYNLLMEPSEVMKHIHLY